LHVIDLPGVVSIGGLNEHIRAEFLAALLEEIGIGLPAFLLEGVQRKTDQRACSAVSVTAWRGVLPKKETDQNTEEERDNDEAAFDGHGMEG
jgi:hypothetical protein